MSSPETLSTFEFFQKFPNEEAARKYFEQRRWGNQPVCGHCGSVTVVECKDHKPMPYRCKDCRKHFSVRIGTVLAESRLPLQKWLLASYMLTRARKDISRTRMARELGVTRKTAWFLAQRIRETWLKDRDDNMDGEMQVDETYVGDREKNKHASKKLHAGRGAVGKTAVVGVRSDGATVITDTHGGYIGLSGAGFNHICINHSTIRDMAHTNGIESFWSLLKRGYIGIYHYMSAKHLHRYVKEFSFRHNIAKIGTIDFIDVTISPMADKCVTYKGLINA